MAKIGSIATRKVRDLFAGPEGINLRLTNLRSAAQSSAVDPGPVEIRSQNATVDVTERGETLRYPLLLVYGEKVINSLTEKFRTFSGTVQVTAEMRHSQDRLEGLQEGLELCADAVTQVLDENRGDWGSGMYYAGGYQVAYGAVKQGGLNYIQVAKVTFEIGVSVS